MKRSRRRNYRKPQDGLDLFTALFLWLAGLIGKLFRGKEKDKKSLF